MKELPEQECRSNRKRVEILVFLLPSVQQNARWRFLGHRKEGDSDVEYELNKEWLFKILYLTKIQKR